MAAEETKNYLWNYNSVKLVITVKVRRKEKKKKKHNTLKHTHYFIFKIFKCLNLPWDVEKLFHVIIFYHNHKKAFFLLNTNDS